MTVGEILKKYLQDNGYDGLAGDECGCKIDDLFPCESCDIYQCEPGYLVTKGSHPDYDFDDTFEFDWKDVDWFISTEKPKEKP